MKKKKGIPLKSVLAFIVTFLIYHLAVGRFFPVDENNVLQAPDWYPIVGIILSITAAYFCSKPEMLKKRKFSLSEFSFNLLIIISVFSGFISIIGLIGLINAERVPRSFFQVFYMFSLLIGGIFGTLAKKHNLFKYVSCISYSFGFSLSVIMALLFRDGIHADSIFLFLVLIINVFVIFYHYKLPKKSKTMPGSTDEECGFYYIETEIENEDPINRSISIEQSVVETSEIVCQSKQHVPDISTPAFEPIEMLEDGQFEPHTQVRTDTTTVYYAYGHVLEVFPPPLGSYYENRDIINAATFIVSDGVAYDLTDKKSIYSIKIPNYHIYVPHKIGEELGVTGYLEYVLRMHSGQCWNAREYDIAIACLEKATELMKYSTMGWSVNDFFRIVNWLNDLGRFKKALKWKDWIEANVPGAIAATSQSIDTRMEAEAKEAFKGRLASCRELGTDLIEIGDLGTCCSKCAMYRKRVYSLTGKNKLFPRFPKDYHWGCGLSGWPYIDGVSEPSFDCEDIVRYSNRPYIDDRTDKEKQDYVERMSTLGKEPPIIKELSLNRIIYYSLAMIIPNDIPKSLGGFSRMRNANSKNYQALVKKAEAVGFLFPQTLEDVKNWPENQ